MRPSSFATAALVALTAAAAAGCGIGYGQKLQSTSIGPYTGDFNIDGDPGYEGTTSYSGAGHAITLYDTSGILLSAAGSAGSAYTAQQKAEKAAIERGGQPGDRYSYSYQVYMPVPDHLTTLSYSWDDTGGVDNSQATGGMATMKHFEFDLTARPKTWTIGADQLTLVMSANWQSWTATGIPGALFDVDVDRIGMPMGLSYGHLLIPHVQVEGRLTWDPLSLFTMLNGSYRADYSAGLHTSAVLKSWLHVEADASYQRLALDFGKRTARELTANVNLVLWWQGPAFWRATHK